MAPTSSASVPSVRSELGVPGEESLPMVLVADDMLLNRTLLRAILAKEPCRIVEATDGREALECARRERPDLILLDIMMPGMDGYEVCRELQADPQLADTPIIILSALSETEDKVRGLELGAADYVTKPFDRGEVVARVHSQLRIRRLTSSLRDANRELVAKQRELDRDLQAAAGIQSSLLPRKLPDLGRVDAAWRFVPCQSVGGDIFNVLRLDRRHVAVYMVDVSGHGVPAAMVTVSVSQSLSPQAGLVLDADGQPREPADVVDLLDEHYPIERFDKHFTICYLLLDLETGDVRYCNAAHPHPMLVRPGGAIERLDAGGTIVGLGGVLPFDQGRCRLAPGDRLFLFTDGIAELTDPSGKDYGEGRLSRVVADPQGGVQDTCDRVVSALEAWSGTQGPRDDITILGLGFRDPENESS